MDTRTVIASVTISLDGCSAGPEGELTGLVEEAGSDVTMTWFEGVYRGSDTALMGRTNYEGFHGYWPPVARDPDTSPRGRDIIVLNSASVIVALLKADLVDRLCLRLAPGAGPDGLPRSGWDLASAATLSGGTLGLRYDRAR